MTGEELYAFWRNRQNGLTALLDEFAITDCEYRVDLEERHFFWVCPDGKPRLVADTKVLCSYAMSDFSLLAGWANRHLAAEACVEPVETVADRMFDCSEEDAWEMAMKIGYAAEADFLYRAPGPQVTVFLGLWNVRPPAEDEKFKAGSPRDYVVRILDALERTLSEAERPMGEMRRLLLNYGRSLAEKAHQTHRGTQEAARLTQTGKRLVALGDAYEIGKEAETLAALGELKEYWESSP